MAIAMLVLEGKALLDPKDAVMELLGFLGSFGAIGALGFRFVVVPRVEHVARGDERDAEEVGGVRDAALRRAAFIGAAGALLLLLQALPNVSKSPLTAILAGVAIASYLAAAFGVGAAWYASTLLAIVLTFQKFSPSKWSTIVNPLHRTAASLWIGTLFVLIVAGLPAVLRAALPRERRAGLVVTLVSRFSTLALTSVAVLVLSGATTGWLHLHTISTLWTTPYGYALIAKLCVVAMVAALGAWNWKRISPRLGNEDAAHALRRSATGELAFAGVVLVITAVLVSLPSPKAPKPAGAPGASAPGAAQTGPAVGSGSK